MTKLVAELAEKWEPNQDGSVWTVHLRNGLKWSDGQPLTTKDVYFQYKVLLSKEMLGAAGTALKDIAGAQDYFDGKAKEISGIKVIDDTTVEFHLTSPSGLFPQSLVAPLEFAEHFFSKFSMQEIAGGQMLRQPRPCSGPFQWSKYVQDQYIEATANPNYWRKDAKGRKLPYLDAVHYLPIPIVASRLSALQSGSLDLMHTDDDPTIIQIRGLSPAQYQFVEDDKITVGEPDMNFSMLNTTLAPLNDIRIRQAMAYAFNQADYLKVICRNVAQPTDGLFPPGNPYHDPSGTGYPTFNAAKASALVSSWMHDNGGAAPLINYSTTPTPESQNAADLIQGYLTNVGFKVTIATVQQAAFIDDAVLGQFHVFGWRQFANVDPDLNYIFWSATSAVSHNGIVTNFARNKDPKIQAACDQGRQSADPAVRKKAYQTVNKMLAKDLPYIWGDRDVWNVCATSTTQNFNHPTDPQHRLGLGMLSGIIWPTEIWKTA